MQAWEGWRGRDGFEDVSAGGLSGVTECSVTGRTGQAVGGKETLRAFKTGGDSGVVGLESAEGRRGSWEEG